MAKREKDEWTPAFIPDQPHRRTFPNSFMPAVPVVYDQYTPAGDRLDVPLDFHDLATVSAMNTDKWVLLALALPPSANRYWRHRRNSPRPYRSKAADQYTDYVAKTCLKAGLTEPLNGQLKIFAWFWRDTFSRDLNNCTKILYDSLQGYAYVNDNQIADEHHIRDYDAAYPRVLLFITEVESADDWKVQEIEKERTRRLRRTLAAPVI